MRVRDLVLLIAGYIVAVLLFQSGFLLRRRALQERSACRDVNVEVDGACWVKPQFRRVVLLVVDALRHDFVAPASQETSSPYLNQMPGIADLLTLPDKAALWHFLADPPTTTLQRLKALTTGSLPTFIDAGVNFAGSAILEDNLIDQMKTAGLNITLLGDDTWVSLFPSQFTARSLPLPSFDVKDLDTVDDAILNRLYSELPRDDWHVLIAHFLGVDHCGHRYGPNHGEMTRKLRQMDEMVKNVTTMMEEDTLLIVLGDHGMTTTDSGLEVDAALLLYSPLALLHSPRVSDVVRQTDLVPTLSLLLGLPIPFSNLGLVIPEVFERDRVVHAHQVNAWQVMRFARAYMEAEGGGSGLVGRDLSPLLRRFSSDDDSTDTVRQFVSGVGNVLNRHWATFDSTAMRLGLLGLVESLLSNAFLLLCTADLPTLVVKSGSILLQLSQLLGQQEVVPTVLDMVLSVQILLNVVRILVAFPFAISPSSLLPLIIALFPVLHAISLFSNSFAVYEKNVTRFLLQSAYLLLLCQKMRASSSSRSARGGRRGALDSLTRYLHLPDVAQLLFVLVVLRFTSLFERCREEQTNCVISWAVQPLHAVSWPLIRMALGCGAALALLGLQRRALANTTIPDSRRLLLNSLVPIAAFSLVLHWLFQLLPHHLSVEFRLYGLITAQMVYVLATLALLLCPANCDLAVIHVVSLPLIMLVGDGIAPSLLGLQLVAFFTLSVSSNVLILSSLWSLLCSYSFFALGHESTFSSIPWDAAFVGLPGNFPSHVLPGLLVLTHLFAGHVLAGLALPLLTPVTDPRFDESIFSFLFFVAVKLCCVSFAAFIHRRHLMVWKIFAPKFIFESISFFVLVLVLLLVCIPRSFHRPSRKNNDR